MPGQFTDKDRVIARCVTHVRHVVDTIEATCDQPTIDEIEGALFPPPTDAEKAEILEQVKRSVLRLGENPSGDLLRAVDSCLASLSVDEKNQGAKA